MDPTSKKAIIEKKIHEEKAFKIVSQLALETVNENFLLTIVTICKLKIKHIKLITFYLSRLSILNHIIMKK